MSSHVAHAVHSLSVVEKQEDNPTRFAVGTGPINTWDQYYVLEASSPEKKQVCTYVSNHPHNCRFMGGWVEGGGCVSEGGGGMVGGWGGGW